MLTNSVKIALLLPDTLEKLERGEMIKDYNANTRVGDGGGAESEDEDDPKSPTSISSQSSSQGYDSAGSDFVDIEGFANIPDSSLPELQLQVISTPTDMNLIKHSIVVWTNDSLVPF